MCNLRLKSIIVKKNLHPVSPDCISYVLQAGLAKLQPFIVDATTIASVIFRGSNAYLPKF